MRKTNSSVYSVIVPVYNLENQIEHCINSILRQSFSDFELILVDDGSTDKSGFACDQYAELDHRIKVIHQKNSGVSAARNAGINESSGRYIVFIDGDDYVEKDYLNELYQYDSDLVIAGYKTVSETGKTIKETRFAKQSISINQSDDVKSIFEQGLLNNVWAKRFNLDYVINNGVFFNEKLSLGEDSLFVVSYIKHISTIQVTESCEYRYIKYSDRETLTSRGFSIHAIDDLERVYSLIYSELKPVLGKQTKEAISFRLGKLYQTFVFLYINKDERVSKQLLRHLFRQKWFKRSLRHPELYKQESKKLMRLLQLRSVRLLDFYLNFIKG